MILLRGRPALTAAKRSRAFATARVAVGDALLMLDTRWVHIVVASRELTGAERAQLEQLLDYGPQVDPPAERSDALRTMIPAESVGRPVLGSSPTLPAVPGAMISAPVTAAPRATMVWVTPRLGTTSPWSSKATDIAAVCGLDAVTRIERAIEYSLYATVELDAAAAGRALSDRMTESVVTREEDLAGVVRPGGSPRPLATVPLGSDGAATLSAASGRLGLALADDEIAYLVARYKELGRDPTDVELMMFAQANSEHCRHKIFNAELHIDGVQQERSLFGMIRQTTEASPKGVLSAYKDNAAVVEGSVAERFFPDEGGVYRAHKEPAHILGKVETHNHPTAISPFPGAATGSGGEIRDEGATGRGAKPKAGLVGFTVSDLRIPGALEPWEAPVGTWVGSPKRIASALDIMVDGPLGGAAFNNEFGRPAILGYFRTFEHDPQRSEGGWTVRGYHKPVMLAGGIGTVRPAHVNKAKVPAGAALIVLGGPAFLIGLGGGAASSRAQGASAEDLDFASVQRDNAEIERRCQEVIDRCWALGDRNPILSIHDVGAGGLSNALPELVHDAGLGARLELRAIPTGEPDLSPLELWCNEAQERYVLAIAQARVGEFAALCARERAPWAQLGTATADGSLTLSDAMAAKDPVDVPLEMILGKPPRMVRHTTRVEPLRRPLDLGGASVAEALDRVLGMPAVADKTFLVTIGDRTVGGMVSRDPMVGPYQVPVADCALTLAGFDTTAGEVMSLGERPPVALLDPAAASRLAIGEAITNLAAAPIGSLDRIKLSCNWMAAASHPGEDAALHTAVHAASACAISLGIAIPVGKDSMSMRTVWTGPSRPNTAVAVPGPAPSPASPPPPSPEERRGPIASGIPPLESRAGALGPAPSSVEATPRRDSRAGSLGPATESRRDALGPATGSSSSGGVDIGRRDSEAARARAQAKRDAELASIGSRTQPPGRYPDRAQRTPDAADTELAELEAEASRREHELAAAGERASARDALAGDRPGAAALADAKRELAELEASLAGSAKPRGRAGLLDPKLDDDLASRAGLLDPKLDDDLAKLDADMAKLDRSPATGVVGDDQLAKLDDDMTRLDREGPPSKGLFGRLVDRAVSAAESIADRISGGVRKYTGSGDGAEAAKAATGATETTTALSTETTAKPTGVEHAVVAPVTLVVTAFGPVTDVRRAVTPELRGGERELLAIDLGGGRARLGGSVLAQAFAQLGDTPPDVDDPRRLAAYFAAIQELVAANKLAAYHDRSDGGLAVAVLEMAFAAGLGLELDVTAVHADPFAALFSEELGAIVEVARDDAPDVSAALTKAGATVNRIGRAVDADRVRIVHGGATVIDSTRSSLRARWSNVTHRLALRRDDPMCAAEEHAARIAPAPLGLTAHLAFEMPPRRPTSLPAASSPSTAASSSSSAASSSTAASSSSSAASSSTAASSPSSTAAVLTRPRVAILREQGVNGQVEMAAAFTRAGFEAVDVHMTDLIEGRVDLTDCRGAVACGGFSFGDVLGAGRGWAATFRHNARARDALARFTARTDTFVLGVCNGCQMLSDLADQLPGAGAWPRFVRNRSEQFEARLVLVRLEPGPSIFFRGMAGSRIPIANAHGEGRAELDAAQLAALESAGLVAARFVDGRGDVATTYPANPNGSPGGVASLTTLDGRITIIMPHPERVFRTAQMSWHPPEWGEDSPWMQMFYNARAWVN